VSEKCPTLVYDFELQRWRLRPQGLRWSEMVLGRRATQRMLATDGVVTVSAYRVFDGRTFYTDPVTNAASSAGGGVLYRIRVRLKEPTKQVVEEFTE